MLSVEQPDMHSTQHGLSVEADRRSPNRPWWLSRLVCFVLLAGLGLAADLLTKQWIFAWRGVPGTSPVWWVIEGYAGIQTAVNPGALFGFGAGWGKAFAALSVIAAGGLAIWLFVYQAARSWWITIAAAGMLAGIFGNMYDRLGLWYQSWMPTEWSSGVRDWILLCYRDYTWPNFNIADSLLVCGTAILVWRSLLHNEPQSLLSTADSHVDAVVEKN